MLSVSSFRLRSRASLAACLALALLAITGEARAEAARASVPAAGHIVWAQVAVRTKPSKAAPEDDRADASSATTSAPASCSRSPSGATRRVQPEWYRISLPGRPNGRTGWVPAASVDVKPVLKEIVVDVGDRTLELRDAGRVVLRTRVAVGAYGMETPLGRYYVMAKFRPTAPVLGAFGFETSAYSKLSEWPGGGIVGIHGTNTPSLLGQAVSHGCIRVANEAILRLRDLVPVGTPIRIGRSGPARQHRPDHGRPAGSAVELEPAAEQPQPLAHPDDADPALPVRVGLDGAPGRSRGRRPGSPCRPRRRPRAASRRPRTRRCAGGCCSAPPAGRAAARSAARR